MKPKVLAKKLPLIGWREWVALPDLQTPAIKAKIDTGARSSALHAFDLEILTEAEQTYLRFKVHPQQRSDRGVIETQAPLLEYRAVRSSNGLVEKRPVIQTAIALGDRSWTIDLTLTNRDVMGFRLLLGRQAIRRQFWVDPGRSFLHVSPGSP
ncbi:MAG: ATP-dependent zinc protease [Prochlorotrichaceae cyanobacterium]|jgi:hypothetical protein